MTIINKLTRRLGLRKLKYGTIHPRTPDYISFKMLAARQKKNHVDFFSELLSLYVDCKYKKHEDAIADLIKKQDVLVDELKLYRERIGKIYR